MNKFRCRARELAGCHRLRVYSKSQSAKQVSHQSVDQFNLCHSPIPWQHIENGNQGIYLFDYVLGGSMLLYTAALRTGTDTG